MPLTVLNDKYVLTKISAAGSYALDVSWGDGHGSIFPFRDLRAGCPCEACQKERPDFDDPRVRTPVEIEPDDGILRVLWENDHESRYPLKLLRELCHCALCAGEQGPVDAYLGKGR